MKIGPISPLSVSIRPQVADGGLHVIARGRGPPRGGIPQSLTSNTRARHRASIWRSPPSCSRLYPVVTFRAWTSPAPTVRRRRRTSALQPVRSSLGARSACRLFTASRSARCRGPACSWSCRPTSSSTCSGDETAVSRAVPGTPGTSWPRRCASRSRRPSSASRAPGAPPFGQPQVRLDARLGDSR